jgi:hypothetical protein
MDFKKYEFGQLRMEFNFVKKIKPYNISKKYRINQIIIDCVDRNDSYISRCEMNIIRKLRKKLCLEYKKHIEKDDSCV